MIFPAIEKVPSAELSTRTSSLPTTSTEQNRYGIDQPINQQLQQHSTNYEYQYTNQPDDFRSTTALSANESHQNRGFSLPRSEANAIISDVKLRDVEHPVEPQTSHTEAIYHTGDIEPQSRQFEKPLHAEGHAYGRTDWLTPSGIGVPGSLHHDSGGNAYAGDEHCVVPLRETATPGPHTEGHVYADVDYADIESLRVDPRDFGVPMRLPAAEGHAYTCNSGYWAAPSRDEFPTLLHNGEERAYAGVEDDALSRDNSTTPCRSDEGYPLQRPEAMTLSGSPDDFRVEISASDSECRSQSLDDEDARSSIIHSTDLGPTQVEKPLYAGVAMSLKGSQRASQSIDNKDTEMPPALGFQCNYCEKSFDMAYKRTRHVDRKHDRRFQCTFESCKQPPFGLKADLDRHVRNKHAGKNQKLLLCLIDGCTRTYKRKDNMLRHRRNKHNLV